MSTCNIGIQNAVEEILNDQLWFKYDKTSGIIEIFDSPNGKINQQNSMGVAKTIATSINKSINDGYKDIGTIAYATFLNNRGAVTIQPTKSQLELINTEDFKKFIELQEQIEDELQEEEFRKLAEESNTYLDEEKEVVYEDSLLQLSDENLKPVSPKMLKFVKEFIKQIGVDYQKVDKIVVNGKVVDANGIARMMSKLIQVVEGKESVALPEEAMHFAVEIIEQTNPKLFEQMLKDINGEAVYQQVNIDYGKNPYYQKDGKPDIRKLKKEAIGKLLVDKVSSIKAQTWWDKIVKFLKELFNKPQMDGVDSLTQFAEMIVSGEDFGTVNDIKSTEDYFQLNEQDKVFNKLKDLDNQITKEDDGVNDDGDPRQSYFIGDKKIKYRVTDFVSDWYKKIFKGEQTEYQKRLAELKAEEGTKGHYHFEKAFDTFVDPDTGLLREEFLEDDDQYLSTLSQVDKDVYATLKENLRDRLLSFPEGSKFLKEAKIYDGRETAGTVDLLIVEPSGKVSIIDWKFIDINTDKYEDVPWYKVKAWNLQMEKYRGILTKNYGVKEEGFKQTRMIPILAMYTDADYQGQNLPKLKGIKIGSVNVDNINEDYLLYVGFKERTGDEKIDNLLDKMNSVYSKISNEKVSPQDRPLKNEQLNSLYKAIRHLEIKKDIIPLINQGKVLNKQVSNFIKKYNDNIKDKSKEELGKETINEFAGMIRAHMEALQPYLGIRQLKYLLNETNPEFNEIKSKLRDTIEDVQDYLDQLESIDREFGKKFVGASYTAEKVVKGITRWFGNAATIQLENLQRLFTLANEATAISNFEVSDEVKKLEELKEKYINWARSKGLSTKDYFKMIIKNDKNELINQYDSNFYKELKTAVAKKDFRWILDNVDKVEVIKKIKEQEEREIDAALNYPVVGSEEHVKAEINRKIAKIKDKYDVSTSTSKGWLQEQFIKIPTEKWESQEWKTLHEKNSSGNYVNQPAIDFYNYIVEKNKLYKEIGYLTGKSARTFLPWIRKGFLEGVMLDGKPQGSLDQFLRNISVDENETAYGQIDPITGKVIDTIPIHFVNQLDGEYSTDLFSTMFLYNEFAIKYKNLSQIEEQARLLLRAEQNKQSIMTSMFGNVIKKGEGFDFNNNNLENTKLYESFMKSIIYQQKYINDSEFDIIIGKISGFGKKFNDKLGMKIFPENMEPRFLTVNKALDQMNRAFQLQALGLNTLSSISNMFGGTANAMINAGKYCTKDDYLKTQAKFLWEKLQGDENAGKILAAVDYFAPFVDSYNRDAKKKLSLSKLTPEGIQDFLMIGLRKGDEMIQYMNAFTFIKNMIVVDGQVKNVREYLRGTDEYKDFYAGNSEQRKARKEKFEKDVERLIEEKGLLTISKLSEEGVLEIPGVERKSDSIIEQRRIIQQFTSDALGSLTEENRRLINMNVYGSSLMVFKNWIPRLVDVRVGGLKYNAAYQAYEWGRYRTFYSMLIPDILKTIKSLTGAVTGNSDVWLEQVRSMFEKQKEQYFNSTGKELKMTESEFISLVNQNIKNQALDLMILTTLLAIGTVAKAMAPDDDEDENVKNVYRFMLKATDKVTDEVSYFYNPMTPFNLISTKGVFPSVGILNNYANFLWDFLRENYGIIVKDDEIIDDAKPIKYLMKSFPVSSQAASYLPMFYPELAKDLGIRMQSTYGVR